MPIRHLAAALGVGASAALVVDAILQNALAAVQSPGGSSLTPWWVIGRVLERSTWIVAAIVVWSLAPALARWLPATVLADIVGRSRALAVVGRAMIALPLVWLVSTWIVVALKISLVGSWDSEGRVFLAGYYYYNVLLSYTPWAAGGIILLALQRHVSDATS